MLPHVLRLAALAACVLLAPNAHAQPRQLERPGDFDHYAGGPQPYPFLDSVSAPEALALLRTDQGRYNSNQPPNQPYDPVHLVLRLGYTADTTYAANLRQIADTTRASDPELIHAALYALRLLGAPKAYFLNLALDPERDRVEANAAVEILAHEPDSATYRLVKPLARRTMNPYFAGATITYEYLLSYEKNLGSMATLDDSVALVAGEAWGGISVLGGVRMAHSLNGVIDPVHAWGRATLRRMARGREATVLGRINVYVDTLRFQRELTGAYEAAYKARIRQWLRDVVAAPGHVTPAFFSELAPPPVVAMPPPPPPPPPPVVPGADVRPILECVAVGEGGALTAYFGYENRYGSAVRVPYGAGNTITPQNYDRRQPQDFPMPNAVAGRPGRTPFYPGYAFAVTFAPAERVVWKLGTRTSTASSTSARCAP